MNEKKEVHVDYGSAERVQEICEKQIKGRATSPEEAYSFDYEVNIGPPTIDLDSNYKWRMQQSKEASNRPERLPIGGDEEWKVKVMVADEKLADQRKKLPEYKPIDLSETKEIFSKWDALLKVSEEKKKKEEWTEACEVEAQRRFEEKCQQEFTGMVIFTVDVGQLSPEKAQDLLDRKKMEWQNILSRLPHDLAQMFNMRRQGGDKIEYIKF